MEEYCRMTCGDIDNALAKFDQVLRNASCPTPIEDSLGNLRKTDADWSKWKHHAGVYYFIQHGSVVYVGRALASTGLGTRVYAQINSFGNADWAAVIKDDDVRVGVICFNGEEKCLASALEVFMICVLKPRFNKRVQ